MSLTTQEFHGSPTLRFAEGPASGAPLLLLHGVTRCWRDWEPILPPLLREWRVIALDQRGHGASAHAQSYLVTDYVADAVRFVREQFREPITVMGHSLGAMVAAGLAAQAPECVRALILEDPPFHTMGRRIPGTSWEAQFVGMREIARRGGTEEEITNALADIRLPVGGGFKRLGELRSHASLRWSAECLAQLDPEVLTPVLEGRWLEGYNLPDILACIARITRITCPVLLLQADPSTGGALTDADTETMSAALSSFHHVPFPGAGHQLHRDHPEAVLHALQKFAT